MGLPSDAKTPTFCEDTAVRVEDLPDYIDDFTALMDHYHTSCVYYAHASVGELHLRPVINLKEQKGLDTMKAMAEDIAKLVAKYKGSLSGEHGDGRARAPYMHHIFGQQVVQLFEQVKDLFDPKGIFNPGKIVRAKPIEEGLRFDPSYTKTEVETVFKWRKELGFIEATEMCNGAGVCRKLSLSGGTMCPSYMATREEKDSTRGRANIFRKVFEGAAPEGFASKELKEALDLCLSCKACKTECPANVDMARMKAEFDHGRQQIEGISLAERFYGSAGKVYPIAQRFAPITNRVNKSAWMKSLLKSTIGLHPKRSLPDFERQTFQQWWRARKKEQSAPESTQKVLLFVDLFTNMHESNIAKDALAVLERLSCHVELFDGSESGRPQLSKGLLTDFKALAEQNIRALYPFIQQGYSVIGLEPSELLTLRDEYLDIFEGELHQMAEAIAAQSYLLEEFVLKQGEDTLKAHFNAADEVLYVHGHCHAKALVGMKPLMQLLQLIGYQPIDLKTGCCGMAGSFGYQEKNYELSMQIGEDRLFPQLRELHPSEGVLAHGFSCRHQIKDGTNKEAQHSAYWLKKALIK
jgi:Fe-S oxidoreductase